MPLIPLDAGLICYSSYFKPCWFDTIFQGDDDDQIWIGVKHLNSSESVVCFRGSDDALDWSRDFRANMICDPTLGDVENGFMIGMRDVFPKLLKELIGKQVIVTGHSLGAARALLFGALLFQAGIIPTIFTFGSPRPGGAKLKEILETVPITSYRNAFDPIPAFPICLSLDPYVHPRDLIHIAAQPITADPALIMRDHHIQLYIVALALQSGDYNE